MALDIMAQHCYAYALYAECHFGWVSLMLSITYAEYHLCCVSLMLSVTYAEYHLCWVSLKHSVTYAEYHLCWVSHINPLCWVSLCWMSLCWVSWRLMKTYMFVTVSHLHPSLTLKARLGAYHSSGVSIHKCQTRMKVTNALAYCQTVVSITRRGGNKYL